jgi:hypothetical protein
VKGLPGHTHNSSAIISVDADYTEYRESTISVAENVWAVGAINMPPGLLTDSVEPDHADERYDRAIEKCVGYMSLFPENCTGHIEEPTRSIGEIRTLVAPKARLETLTYIDERGGWVVPVDENDEKASEHTRLVSRFPDVHVSVMPRSKHQNATLNPGVSCSSLYMELAGLERYRIDVLDAAAGTIGWTAAEHRLWRAAVAAYTTQHAIVNGLFLIVQQAGVANTDAETAYNAGVAGNDAIPQTVTDQQLAALLLVWTEAYADFGVADANRDKARVVLGQLLTDRNAAAAAAIWDNTLRFVWDPDRRLYKMLHEQIVVLNQVTRVVKTTGVRVGDDLLVFDGIAERKPHLTVTFPILETSRAFDGSCWLSSIRNEEALDYATRQNGLSMIPNIQVDVLVNAGSPYTGAPSTRCPGPTFCRSSLETARMPTCSTTFTTNSPRCLVSRIKVPVQTTVGRN